MKTIIRISSILILLSSVIWLAISPTLRPLLISIIALFLLIVTFVEFNEKIKEILTGVGLLGSVLWIIIDYQNIEPYVSLLSAALAYISIKNSENAGDAMLSNNDNSVDSHNISDEPSRLHQKYRELKQQWDGLTERIQAITDDLAIEIDSERKRVLQIRLSRLNDDRKRIESLMRKLENEME